MPAIAGGALIVGVLATGAGKPYGQDIGLVDAPLLVLALGCVIAGVVRLTGRTRADDALVVLGATVLAYVASFWLLGSKVGLGLPVELAELHATIVSINLGALAIAVSAALALHQRLNRDGGPGPFQAMALTVAFAGAAIFFAGSYLPLINDDGDFWRLTPVFPRVLTGAALATFALAAVAARWIGVRARVVAVIALCVIGAVGLGSAQALTIDVQAGYDVVGLGMWVTALGGVVALAGAAWLWRERPRERDA